MTCSSNRQFYSIGKLGPNGDKSRVGHGGQVKITLKPLIAKLLILRPVEVARDVYIRSYKRRKGAIHVSGDRGSARKEHSRDMVVRMEPWLSKMAKLLVRWLFLLSQPSFLSSCMQQNFNVVLNADFTASLRLSKQSLW